jgi:hypothetical protein
MVSFSNLYIMGNHKFLDLVGQKFIRVCERISYGCSVDKVILRHIKHGYKLQYIFNNFIIMCCYNGSSAPKFRDNLVMTLAGRINRLSRNVVTHPTIHDALSL